MKFDFYWDNYDIPNVANEFLINHGMKKKKNLESPLKHNKFSIF